MITHGELNVKNYNPFALSDLRKFKVENFYLAGAHNKKLEESVGTSNSSTHIFVHAGKFSFNFFEHGKTESLEQLKFNHNKLLQCLSTSEKGVVIVYDFHPRLKTYKEHFDIMYLDESGKQTNQANAKEIILHNV
jgi:hypothetical protein